jgi:hypothetical protein
MEETDGAYAYENTTVSPRLVKVENTVTVTTCDDALLDVGVLHVSCVELITFTAVHCCPPIETAVLPDWNPVPVIATNVPPATGPAVGEMLATLGNPAYVNPGLANAADETPYNDTVIVDT